MTERWGALVGFGSREERFCRILDVIHEKYLQAPEFSTAEGRRAFVDALWARRVVVAGEIWAQLTDGGGDGAYVIRSAERAVDQAEQQLIGEIIARIPARTVHEVHHAWAYLEAEVENPVDGSVGELADNTLWRDRAAVAHVDTIERLGDPADYDRVDAIEDVAVPPDIQWTEADRKAALEEAIRVYGIKPGEWYEVEWPPEEGSLWSPGHIERRELDICADHQEEEDEDVIDSCTECYAVEIEVVQMAVWCFATRLTLHRLWFDEHGELGEGVEEVVDDRFEVREILQDPREILIGPPGRGTQW